MPALDAPRNFHFAVARQQRHGAHFAQVHADRVVDLVAQAGGQVQVDNFFAVFEFFVEILRLFEDLNAGDVKARQHLVEVAAVRQIAGQNFAYLVEKDVSFTLA